MDKPNHGDETGALEPRGSGTPPQHPQFDEPATIDPALKAIFETIFDAVLLHDNDLIVQANEPAGQILGATVEELRGMTIHRFFIEGAPSQTSETSSEKLRERGVVRGTTKIQRLDGAILDVEYRICAGIKPKLFLTVFRDITAQVRTVEGLRMSEQLFENAFQYAASGMAVVTPEGQGTLVNQALASMLGYEVEELAGKAFQKLIHPVDLDAAVEFLQVLVVTSHKGVARREMRFMHKNGSVVWLLLAASIVGDSAGAPQYVVAQVTDITERKRNAGELGELAQLRRSLLRRLISAQEAERRRLATEIHDGPLQSIAVTLLALDRATRRFERNEQDLALEELRSAKKHLRTTVDELRSVLSDVSDEILSTYGLQTALKSHVERMVTATGIEVSTEITSQVRLPAELDLLLFRLGQEALANISKHARATRANLSLYESGNDIVLRISDDGVGVDPEQIESHQADQDIGISSMRERIETAGGSLNITSAPDKGTVVLFTCPKPPPVNTRAPDDSYWDDSRDEDLGPDGPVS